MFLSALVPVVLPLAKLVLLVSLSPYLLRIRSAVKSLSFIVVCHGVTPYIVVTSLRGHVFPAISV